MTSTEEPTANVKFCLALPCEAVSVPIMRRVLGDTLRNLGVVEECVADILVAVTEACTNVLMHSGPTRGYEVVASVGRGGCLVEVVDTGVGAGRRRGRAHEGSVGRRGQTRTRAAGRLDHAAPAQPRANGHVRRGTDHGEGWSAAGRAAAGESGGARQPRPLLPMPPARGPEDLVIARLPESGRGLQIMRALVDDVTLESAPDRGTVVSMRKRVAWRQDAPLVGMTLRDAG